MRIISILLALAILAGCSGTGGTASTEQADTSSTTDTVLGTSAPQALSDNSLLTETVPEVSPEISDEYSGFVHMDAVQLNGQIYEIYYWNKGEFTYTQFAIVKNGKVVFDSKASGITIEGGSPWSEKDELWAEAVVQNNRSTFLFGLMDNRPDPAYIVVEEIDGDMKVTVNDHYKVWFEDMNEDGNGDLLAYPSAGQMPLSPALVAVYKLQGTQYVPDIDRTKQYAEEQLLLNEQEFKNNPEAPTLDSLLGSYLILGKRSFAMTRFEEFYEWAGQREGEGGYVDEYRELMRKTDTAGQFQGWMDKLEPLRTVE